MGRRDFYDGLTKRVSDLARELLEQRVEVFQLEARTKSVTSFVEKLRKKSEQYEDPFRQMTDLVGVRIVTYYQEDVPAVAEIIHSEFHVDPENSVDKTKLLSLNEFGYKSRHFIVCVGPARRNLVEWSPYASTWIEIQVRTALEHAWAAIEHKLNYKSGVQSSNELGRGFSRLSALLEVADNEFSRLRSIADDLQRKQLELVETGDLSATINASSLHAYLRSAPMVLDLEKAAMTRGWILANQRGLDTGRLARDEDDFLQILGRCGVDTFQDLETIARPTNASELLRKVLAEFEARHINPDASIFDLMSFLVLSRSTDPVTAGSEVYSGAVLAVLQAAIDSVPPAST